ncbi:MAG: hypothetical protein BroJett029_25030 [Alphaproteobacteria bacterium]|nr:MAG: hypothetical protein BroJett029_25030 [Alphaproteobacteria bacterium]
MSATGLEVFDKTVQTTNIWLNEITAEIGPDRQAAWHALGVVLRCLRDRVPPELAAHLAAELPLLVRGLYYDQYRPTGSPEKTRSRAQFVQGVADGLSDMRPIDPELAIRAVLAAVSRHVAPGQVRKLREALPEDIRALWPDGSAEPLNREKGGSRT